MAGALLHAAACDRPTASGGAGSARSTEVAAPGAISVRDDAGREVRLRGPAQRIISLVPARTEALVALGAADRLIARTQYDLDPALAALPSVGNALNPSIEWLAAQRPDLVIAWADAETRAVVDRLAELGIATYGTRVETLAEHDAALRDLGELTGLGAAADSLRAMIAADLGAVGARVAGRRPRRVLFLVGYETPFTAGPGTFLHEVIETAGGENVFGDLAQRWAQVSIEEIVRRRPEAIVVATRSAAGTVAAELARRPGWRDTEAVRSGAVFEVEADLFTRVGPRVAAAAAQLAALLHPALP